MEFGPSAVRALASLGPPQAPARDTSAPSRTTTGRTGPPTSVAPHTSDTSPSPPSRTPWGQRALGLSRFSRPLDDWVGARPPPSVTREDGTRPRSGTRFRGQRTPQQLPQRNRPCTRGPKSVRDPSPDPSSRGGRSSPPAPPIARPGAA